LVPEQSSCENKKAIPLLENATFSIDYLFRTSVKVPGKGIFSTSTANERRD